MKTEDKKFIESVIKYISENPMNEALGMLGGEKGGDLHYIILDVINRLENPDYQYGPSTGRAVRNAIVALKELLRIFPPNDNKK